MGLVLPVATSSIHCSGMYTDRVRFPTVICTFSSRPVHFQSAGTSWLQMKWDLSFLTATSLPAKETSASSPSSISYRMRSSEP